MTTDRLTSTVTAFLQARAAGASGPCDDRVAELVTRAAADIDVLHVRMQEAARQLANDAQGIEAYARSCDVLAPIGGFVGSLQLSALDDLRRYTAEHAAKLECFTTLVSATLGGPEAVKQIRKMVRS